METSGKASEVPASPLAALQSEIAKLRGVLDSVGAYVYTKDLAGFYTYGNQKVCELFGVSASELVGKRDPDFWDAATAEVIAANDRAVMQTGESHSVEEITQLNGNPAPRIFLSQKSPLRDAAGKVIGMCGISTDITERQLQILELEANKGLLNTVLNNLDAFVYLKDPDLRFLYVNDKTAALFGKPIGEIVGRTNHEVLPFEIAEHFSETDRKVFAEGRKQVAEESSVGADGVTRYYWSHKIPLLQGDRPYAYLGFSTDITELHEAREELRRLAMTDSLTGLYNRRYFMDAAQREFRHARRYGEALSIISIDIDHFKWVNDEHGHPVGDEILCRVAADLVSHARASDLLARMGGEEFLLLLPHTDLESATHLADRIRRMISDRRFEGDWQGVIRTTVSMGVTALFSDDAELDVLLIRADRALYQAKEHGRNRVCVLAQDATERGRPAFIVDDA